MDIARFKISYLQDLPQTKNIGKWKITNIWMFSMFQNLFALEEPVES